MECQQPNPASAAQVGNGLAIVVGERMHAGIVAAAAIRGQDV
jgi:hypothetical protein